MIYFLYTDDSILAGPDKKEIERTIGLMMGAKLNITIEGDLTNFLGVSVDWKKDGTIHLTQQKLINQVLDDLRMNDNKDIAKPVPAASSKLLSRHQDSPPFDSSFNYQSVIGTMNYVKRGLRPNISYALHQCARFSIDPKVEHGQAVRWIAWYQKGTGKKGMILRPDTSTQKSSLLPFSLSLAALLAFSPLFPWWLQWGLDCYTSDGTESDTDDTEGDASAKDKQRCLAIVSFIVAIMNDML